MWPYTVGFAETIDKVSVAESFHNATPPVGEYALREAPASRPALEPLMEVLDLIGSAGAMTITGFGSSPAATGMDAVWYVCRFLFAGLFEKPPTKSAVTQAIEAIVGSRRPFQPFYVTTAIDTVTSRWLARQYWFDQLHDLVENRLEIKKRLAGARNLILQHFKRSVAETGSSAAIAKRMNPLGAPRKSHEGEIHGTCNERPE